MDIRPVEFSERYLECVQSFRCGTEPWAAFAEEWIKQAPPFDGALLSIRRYHNTVWLYFAPDDPSLSDGEEYMVGFSSLGVTRWKIPPPDGKPRDVGLIPMLAVASAFQGKPGALGAKHYSRQIMEHVISQACERGFRELCLQVHADNIRAIRLYESFGFQALGVKNGRGNIRMLKLLD